MIGSVGSGCRAAFRIYGDPRASTTVVALHGLRGTHHGLAPIARRLTDLRVVVPDLPGFGGSAPLPTAHDVAGYARWATELLAAHGPDTVLLGHSFGSVIAAAAVAAGAPVRGLVLVNPIPRAGSAGSARPAAALAASYHRLAGAVPERVGDALLRLPAVTRLMTMTTATTRDPALRRWIHAEHRRHYGRFAERRVVLEAFAAATTSGVGVYADRVRVPVLLLVGACDRLAPLAEQHSLAGRFADARLRVLPGTGHLAHYEAPAGIAGEVWEFVRELDR